MNHRVHRACVFTVAVAAMAAITVPSLRVSGQMPVRAPRYAITNARIVTAAGPVIDKGTVVMREGIIEDVGAAVTAPADALVIDGNGLVVYPGMIDMSNSTVVEVRTTTAAAPPPVAAAAGRGGRGAAVATPDAVTWADQEREARARYLRPDVDAASLVELDGDDVRRLAAAGITSALAVPSQGIIRGQSALVNLTAPPDPAGTSALATYRRGVVVVRSPVAQHVVFATGGAGGGGGGYPGALLGVIAFARQSFYDAQWQKEARAFAERNKSSIVGGFEPALDALAPALERRVPVAFDASEQREILRALAFAREFNLDPIIVGGAEAASVVDDLKAAKAAVIVAANFQAAGGGAGGRGGGGGGRGGGDADTPLRITRMRQNAAKVPAALEKAGIPFAFTIGGLQTPAEFVRSVSRTVREGGLSEDAAVKALSVNAARLAGAAERLGTIEKGKMANVIVTDGNLFDTSRIRHVFVAGWPVDLEAAAPPPAGGRGRGAH
jgi:imidazolonepropionase-like amidohydrolase